MKYNYVIVTIILILLIQNNKINGQELEQQQNFDNILDLIFKTNVTSIPSLSSSSSVSNINETEEKKYDNILDSIFRTNSTIILSNDDQKPDIIQRTTSTTTTTTTTTQKPIIINPSMIINDGNATYENCGENKLCVPFYLCKNGTDSFNTDGELLIDIRFDGNKPCSSYLEKCCNYIDQQIQNNLIKPQLEYKRGCGYRNSDGILFRIEGNNEGETEYGEFPWMIAVLVEEIYTNEIYTIYKCGGSLIHPSVVLSAAHCIYNYEINSIIVRAGEWDTQTKDEIYEEQNRKIKNIIMHENFNKRNLNNDIALLFTEEPFKLGIEINTICLPPSNINIKSNNCFATGWGKDKFGKEGNYQVIMKKIEMPMVSNDICQEKLRTTRLTQRFNLHESFNCAGGEIGKDACKGDGGGPLVCPISNNNNNLRYHQSGIVAWGIGCGTEIPGVYGNVPYFRNWIDNIFIEKNLERSFYIAS